MRWLGPTHAWTALILPGACERVAEKALLEQDRGVLYKSEPESGMNP